MSSSYGRIFRITTFGESHGAGIGVVIDGVPSRLPLDEADIQIELDRRRPGQSKITTQRQEPDRVEILSGVFEGVTTGTSLAMLIRNLDARSQDYGNLATVFRPGHADFGYAAKYGVRDYRGGGRSSGRETAARVAAGAVAKKILKTLGIAITGHTLEIGGVRAGQYRPECIEANIVRCADPDAVQPMLDVIAAAQAERDSVGGIVECRIQGVPAGWGEPVFDKLDAELAKAALSIGGVKGVEFGIGFGAAQLRGSANNDPIRPEGFVRNHAGGILGGMSNGDEIVFRVAVKPTPSIAARQQSVDAGNRAAELEIKGRHDPCLCPRIVVVLEAMAALVLVDMAMLQHGVQRLIPQTPSR
jgi:chorismate synthase